MSLPTGKLAKFESYYFFRASLIFELLPFSIEDLTHPNMIRQDSKCDRTVCLYGYVRGCPIKKDTFIHIPGESTLSSFVEEEAIAIVNEGSLIVRMR